MHILTLRQPMLSRLHGCQCEGRLTPGLQNWEDRIKHSRAQHSEAQRDELSSSAPADVAPEEAAFIALKKWAGTGRKCRQALKRASPTAVEEMELHYLQLMRQVRVQSNHDNVD